MNSMWKALIAASLWARRERKAEDIIMLGHGKHEIEINLHWTPRRVLLSFEDTGERPLPVCNGNVDFISSEVVKDGFILYANIHAAQRSIRWLAQQ